MSKNVKCAILEIIWKCSVAIVFFGGVILFLRTIPLLQHSHGDESNLPLVINTWSFSNATIMGISVLRAGGSALDAVEQGCSVCEREQCDGTVGYGGSPDEQGETTLDAMIMDGITHDVGAVGALRQIKEAISVARRVLENTHHTLLVGSQATDFAVAMGFRKQNLTTEKSAAMHQSWEKKKCQPNFWKNVTPDPTKSCGPYKPIGTAVDGEQSLPESSSDIEFDQYNHDTIGMIAIDSVGHIAGGTSTNGARNKIPGRVGDSPIAGSGCYVDRKVGGAAATGDGDVMMRLLPALVAVERMRQGLSPVESANKALRQVVDYYPTFSGAIVTTTIQGEYGAACHGFEHFEFSVASGKSGDVQVVHVECSQ